MKRETVPQARTRGASYKPEFTVPIWQLNIDELAGRNIETVGREEVNEMLKTGWVLLHIYTLKYREDGVWRERPMAILGKPAGLNR